MSESAPSTRFEVFIAVCIALATVAGAILAARATLLNDDANTSDQTGLASAIDLALAQSTNESQRAQNLIAFLGFAQHRRAAELMVDQMDKIEPASPLWTQLDDQSSAEWNKAISSRYFFDSSYYDKFNGTWDQQAFMDGKLVEAASLQDLNPDPHFGSADAGRTKAGKLIGVIAVLAFALFSFAVANVIRSRAKYLVVGLGSLILIGSIALAIVIESGVL
jgi:hypothetical protein